MATVTAESRATLRTSLGNLVLEFIPDKAPKTCENFAKLANKGFFDGTTFHRIVRDFIAQGGSPDGSNKGGPGYTIRPEFNDTPHVKGTVSMARDNDPHSAGSQFFICLGEAPYLDSRYTAFAKVVDGLDVLDKLNDVQTDLEPRFQERSVPRDPIYLNGVDLEGVAFEAEPAEEKAPEAARQDDDGANDDGDDSGEGGGKRRRTRRGRRGGQGRPDKGEGQEKGEAQEKGEGQEKGEAPADEGGREAEAEAKAKAKADQTGDLFEQAAAAGDEDEAPKKPARKATAKKAGAKKAGAKKATAKKASSKKATAKKATRKKATKKTDDGE